MKNGRGVSGEKVNFSRTGGDVLKKKDFAEDPIDAQRREKVKDAMLHAWSSYEKYAWGHDELQVWLLLLISLLCAIMFSHLAVRSLVEAFQLAIKCFTLLIDFL